MVHHWLPDSRWAPLGRHDTGFFGRVGEDAFDVAHGGLDGLGCGLAIADAWGRNTAHASSLAYRVEVHGRTRCSRNGAAEFV